MDASWLSYLMRCVSLENVIGYMRVSLNFSLSLVSSLPCLVLINVIVCSYRRGGNLTSEYLECSKGFSTIAPSVHRDRYIFTYEVEHVDTRHIHVWPEPVVSRESDWVHSDINVISSWYV